MKSRKKRKRSLKRNKVKLSKLNLIMRSACATIGAVSVLLGFIIIILGNLNIGLLIAAFGLLNTLLALGFNHIKVKILLFEIEADQDKR